MIEFDREKTCFFLNGKNYSYVMAVNGVGMLQHIYYGKKLSSSDAAFLVKTHGEAYAPHADDPNYDMQTDMMPSECGSFARGDFREPTVVIERADGARMSRFRYLSHQIEKGALPLQGMPCARQADETLIVTLKDDFSDTEIDLKYSVSDASDVLVRSLAVRNVGSEPVQIKKAFSFCTELPDTRRVFSALRLTGAWGRERAPVVSPLSEGVLRLRSSRGYSSHHMNPFLALIEENAGEERGECYGFALLYSGSFALTAELTHNGITRVQGGIGDEFFSWKLCAGETLETPQAALCYSAQGLGGMSRAYHDFFRTAVVDPKYVYARRPIVVNNWEATYFDFDNEKLFDAEGHLTDDGLYALKDGTLDDLGALEAAEHLSFCDYCLLRYTELIDAAPACLQEPMRDLIPQVQNLMRLRRFRIMTNRYVSAAAAVVLAFVLWGFASMGASQRMAARSVQPQEPRVTFGQWWDTTVNGFYDSLNDTFSNFTLAAENGLAQLQHHEEGGTAAKGE